MVHDRLLKANPAHVTARYSSTDLLNWKKVGAVLSKRTLDVVGDQPLTYCKIERPKLLYNAKTQMYVLWAHWEEHSSYDASHVVTATASAVEGPYVITSSGHRRPGAGERGGDAMGDRIGSMIVDYSTAAKDPTDLSHPSKPVSHAGYPPQILQYADPSPSSPNSLKYVDQAEYGTAQIDNQWTYQLMGVRFNLTLKAIAVNMTAFDTTAYDKYKDSYNVKPADYIVRYPTSTRSTVTTVNFTMGDPGNSRTALLPPVISPGLDESSSTSVVYVNPGDAAFITVATDAATIYYTTDGSDPTSSARVSQYWPGTRIVVDGPSGTRVVVKALASVVEVGAHGNSTRNSSIVTQTYEVVGGGVSVPLFRPVINYPSGIYNATSAAFGWQSIRIYSPSHGTNSYYTMDGKDPDPPNLGANVGYGSRDMTVWQDPATGDAYLISAQDNVWGRLWQLTDDFTDVVPEKEYDVWVGIPREAPALVRNGGKGGKYVYLATSSQSGYFPNQGQYKRTQNLADGFALPRDPLTGYRNGTEIWSDLQPFGDSTTFYSQPTFIVDVGTPTTPAYVYVGDRYDTVGAAGYRSNFVWLPLVIDDSGGSEAGVSGSGSFRVQFQPQLQIDLASGKIVPPEWRLLSLNKPVVATPSTPLTFAQSASGVVNFSAAAANDGHDFDVNVYSPAKHYYSPIQVPYFWRVDLGAVYTLDWVGLSFLSIGGSDAANRYTLAGSVDGTRWIELVDNTQNVRPGYANHDLQGQFRFVQLNDMSVWDVDHNKEADWETGLQQLSVYGH